MREHECASTGPKVPENEDQTAFGANTVRPVTVTRKVRTFDPVVMAARGAV